MANKKITFELDVDGKPIDVVIDKTLNLKQQVRELTKELNKTQEGTEQFRLLSSKLNETKDNVDRVNAKSRELFSTISLLPGPIGDFGNQVDNSINLLKTFSGFKLSDIANQFKELGKDALDIVKNILGLNAAQKALAVSETQATAAATAETAALELQTVATTEAEVATIGLGTALKAIGIGLLITGLATLIAYWDDIKEALFGATEAQKQFNAIQEKAVSNSSEQVSTLQMLGKLLNSTNVDQYQKNEAVNQYNKVLGDTLGKVKSWAELEEKLKGKLPQYIEYLKLKAQADGAYLLAQEALKDKIKKESQNPEELTKWYDYLIAFNFGGTTETVKKVATETRDAQAKELEKTADQLFTKYGDFKKKADEMAKTLGLGPEKISYTGDTKTTTTKEDPRVQQKKDTIKAIADLEQKSFIDSLSAQEKELYETNQHYAALIYDATRFGLDTTLLKEQQGKDVAAINEKYRLQEADRAEKASKFIQDWEIKFQQDSQKAMDKIANDKAKTRSSELQDQMDNIDRINKLLDEDSANDLERLKQKEVLLNEQEQTELSNTELTEDAKTQIRQKYKDKRTQLLLEEVDAEKRAQQEKYAIMLQYADGVAAVGSIIGSLAGKNVELQKLAILLEKGAAIAKIVINASKDVAAVTGAAQAAGWLAGGPILNPAGYAANIAAGVASATKIKVGAALSIATITAQGLGQFIALNEQGGGGGQAPAPNSAQSLGKNYGDGGMINGPLHAQGGVMINAEGGEAVMTRGAVTMFAPLLSTLNQMGGGTSFTKGAVGQANYDSPTSSAPMEQQIIKTYVVSNELTTTAERQARLKDLSTL